jgi:OOP family OmpA-OmpF porin
MTLPSRGPRLARGLRLVAGLSLLGVAACAGPVSFVDERPIAIAGDPPAPPPAPAKPERVVVTQDRIQINEKIQFDYNKATIRPESASLLEEIRSVIVANPHIKKISIEGHTCSVGGDKFNQKLSEARAASVRQYLVEKGIPDGKLTSAGHGKTRPIASNDTDDGKEKNRRVEFLIVEQDTVTKTFEVDPSTGERREVKTASAEAQ